MCGVLGLGGGSHRRERLLSQSDVAQLTIASPTSQSSEARGFGVDQFGEDGRVYSSAVYFGPAALTAAD